MTAAPRTPSVCMIGLGPVGTVSGICFAKQGFRVIGVDNNPARVEAFERFQAPFVEPGVNELVAEVLKAGTFSATTDFDAAVKASNVVMIAVGTPTPESGEPDLSFLDAVAKSLGETLKTKTEKGTVIVLRSTVPPGTMRNRLAPVIEKHSGLKAGVDFHIASNPEFLREGLAIKDFFDTGRIVIGADNDEAAALIEALYKDVVGLRIRTDVETAEFAKYVDNTWHALKVAFGNEIGRMALAFGGNPDETAKIFLADNRLNISQVYLRPGFAFGGSCLPKDVRGLECLAKKYEVKLPVVSSILASNEEQIDQGVAAILETGAKKVGLLGMAFKLGVDDLRESPSLYVAQKLRAAGVEVMAHDPHFNAGDTMELYRNGGTITISSLDEVVAGCGALAMLHNIPEYRDIKAKPAVNLTQVIQKVAAKIEAMHKAA
jgi:GDP-mannose 6-dehydrogenase